MLPERNWGIDAGSLNAPLRARKSYRWALAGDLFHESVPDEWIDMVFAVMALAPWHTFQVLTKRSARMRAYMEGCAAPPSDLPLREPWVTQWHRRDSVATAMYELAGQRHRDSLGKVRQLPLPNVWLGVSAEDQRRADERVPDLLATPAAVRWVSAEPLLGPINFHKLPLEADGYRASALYGHEVAGAVGQCIDWVPPLDWIVVGGESGPGARAMNPAWPRQIRDACEAASVAYLFKQWGAWADVGPHERGDFISSDPRIDAILSDHPVFMAPVGKKAAGRLLDGVEHNDMPEVRS